MADMLRWLAHGSRKLATRDMAPLYVLLALATLIRLPFMTFPGYWHDLASYVTWGDELVRHGFSQLYAVRAVYLEPANSGNVADTAINYPPGMPYLFGGVVLLYNVFLAPFTHTSLTSLVLLNGIGPFFAKLPMLLTDLATTTLLYFEARKRHSERFALLAAASFAFSPAVLYDGVIWGQTDALVMLPVLIALFAIFSKRYALAGASLAVAVLIKAQAVIFIPLLLLYLWRWTRRQDFYRFSVSLLATAFVLLLPVMIPRFQPFDMLANVRAMSYGPNFAVSRDAFNFWWLTLSPTQPMSNAVLGVNLGVIGDALLGVATLAVAFRLWRRREPAYLCFGLAMEVFGFFMFMGGQLDRYLVPFIPLMLAAVIQSERKGSARALALYVIGTALCLLNMVIAIGAFLTGIAPMIPYVDAHSLSQFAFHHYPEIGLIAAVCVNATFAYAMWVYLSGRFKPLAEELHTLRQPVVPESAYATQQV